MAGRKEAGSETVHAARGNEPPVEDHVPGEVSVFGSEAVSGPGPHARPAGHPAAGMQEVVGGVVFRESRHHGADHAQVVGAGTHLGKEFADRQAALATRTERPGTAQCRPVVLELGGFHAQTEGLSVFAGEARFRVKGIHLRDASIHVEEDDIPSLGPVVRLAALARGPRVGRSSRVGGSTQQRVHGQCAKAQGAVHEQSSSAQGGDRRRSMGTEVRGHG